MTVLAVLLVSVEIGKENEVFEKLSEIPEVKEVFMTYGIYDIIAVIEAKDMDEMRNLITGKIRRLDGIKETLTAIVVMHRKKGPITFSGEQGGTQ